MKVFYADFFVLTIDGGNLREISDIDIIPGSQGFRRGGADRGDVVRQHVAGDGGVLVGAGAVVGRGQLGRRVVDDDRDGCRVGAAVEVRQAVDEAVRRRVVLGQVDDGDVVLVDRDRIVGFADLLLLLANWS